MSGMAREERCDEAEKISHLVVIYIVSCCLVDMQSSVCAVCGTFRFVDTLNQCRSSNVLVLLAMQPLLAWME
jgi:NADH:ubiquinone oxidoreductase subunit B-like Fe-S oxidoreductase